MKKALFAAFAMVASFFAVPAMAALPAGAAEAIASYQTDVVAVFGLIIAAGIAIYAVRKLGSKLGWL